MSDPTHHDRAELVEDARHLGELLADAHPSPFRGHGGRAQFHRRLAEFAREIPDDGESLAAFYERVAGFLAPLRDGHTRAVAPDGVAAAEGRLPLSLRVVGAELYVETVHEDPLADLVGGRLLAVGDVPAADLVERQAAAGSGENAFGDRINLVRTLERLQLRRVLDDPSLPVAVRVETPDGTVAERALSPVGDGAEPAAALDAEVGDPPAGPEPSYRLLDGGETAVLSVPDMTAYREAAEFYADTQAGDAAERVAPVYESVVGEPAPEDADAAELLDALPSVADLFADLRAEVADGDTERLVVDTRGNTGGNSLFTIALGYALYGRERLGDLAGEVVNVPKDSAAYRRQYGDDGPLGEASPANPGGFDFERHFVTRERAGWLAWLEEWVGYSPTLSAAIEDGRFEGGAPPGEVVVVTDAATYSAGAEPAFLLSKLGAEVVGVPPSQAPNRPRDLLREALPNTGLTVGVSFRHVEYRPGEPGGVLSPDRELTPGRFEALGRPADAGLLLALGREAEAAAD